MSLQSKRLLFFLLFGISIPYSYLVYTKGTEYPVEMNDMEKKGKRLFQKYNCIACHQIYGLGGYLGPDLTNVISDSLKGEAYARSFLQNGTQVMPDFHLKEEEINALLAYLKYVSENNSYDVRSYTWTSYGTFYKKEKHH